ncbi:MAG: hypothetical protein K8I02_08420, partial [Candidatus Methylomirabilis sp.]|nr:hypothetical protein [Deltaproteobacteria bacterium]
ILAARPEEAGRHSVAKVCIAPMGAVGPALQLAAAFRRAGVATEVLGDAPKVKKAMAFIDKVKIPFAVVYGENEAATGTFKVKRMSTGEQREFASAEEAAAFLRDAE